jgi:hypothetical protein
MLYLTPRSKLRYHVLNQGGHDDQANDTYRVDGQVLDRSRL